jgi:hypothetical protein
MLGIDLDPQTAGTQMNIRTFVVLLFLLGIGLSTFAQQSGTNLTIRSAAGRDFFCMDAAGDRKADGTPVMVYHCHPGENQRWTVTASEGGWSALIGTGGFCLDVRGGNSRADGTPVQLWRCHFGHNQRFRFTPDGRIVELDSGKCLMAVNERDGAPIILDNCDGNPWHGDPWQRWQLVP